MNTRLSVVVPAYGEAVRIGATVARLREELADLEPEVLVVDDGSVDDTAEVAERAGAAVVRLGRHRGKGAAVRAGALAAKGRVVVVTDADLAYAPDQLRRLLAAVEAGADMAVGNRSDPRSVTEGRGARGRALASRLFNRLAGPALVGRYPDTQCGCKAFAAGAAQRIFSRSRLDGFAFDVEVLHLAERAGFEIVQLPVTVRAGGASSVRLGRAAVRMAFDVWRLRRWARAGVYDAGQ